MFLTDLKIKKQIQNPKLFLSQNDKNQKTTRTVFVKYTSQNQNKKVY